ncbi:Mitochondrial import protein mas5 [Gossypium arboreum]|uniref:Mitochondrial import protein mas5 n=1 Tax=Gossypium arboreum TaxID=29729 RepID=A0A0B0MR64_GOSAR|nr:Mitochondrial import protein mas5 [Gossypium arboreum]
MGIGLGLVPQASIRDQGTSEASITLSPEALVGTKGLVNSFIFSTRSCVTHGLPHEHVVQPCVHYISIFQVSMHSSKHRQRHGRVSQPCRGHGLTHVRVPWPCALKGLLTSKTECQGFYTRAETRACHGRVRDMSHGHGRLPSRVKTPIGSNRKINS